MPWSINSYTNEEKNFINNNIQNMTNKEIAKNLNMSESKVLNYLRITGLSRKNKISLRDLKNFHQIPDYPDYLISKDSTVVHKDKLTIITPRVLQDGYISIRLNNNGKRTEIRLNRLVASVFLNNDDPINKTQVDHIDGNIKNNYYSNLEWVTPEENIKRKNKTKIEHKKLNKSHVEYICNSLETNIDKGIIITYISESLNIDRNAARKIYKNIKDRKTYKNISNNYNF